MAEFGASSTEAPETQNFVQPLPPVETAQVREPIAVQGVTNLFRQFREARAGQREKEGNAFLSRFANEQLGIAMAVDQGKLTPQAATSRMTTNLMSAIHSNPGLRDELLKTNTTISNQAGIKELVTEGTEEYQRQQNLWDNLVEQGLVKPDASQEEFIQAEENFRLAAEAQRRYKAEMDTISMERAQLGLSRERIQTLDLKESRQSEKLFIDSYPAMMDEFQTKGDKYLARLNDPEWNEAEVVDLINREFNMFEQQWALHFSKMDSDQANALMKGFREYKDLLIAEATGEQNREMLTRKRDDIIRRNEIALLESDPVFSRVTAASNLGLEQLMMATPKLRNAVSDAIMNGLEGDTPTNPFSGDEAKREAYRSYLDFLSADPETLDDDQRAEQERHITNVLQGVKTFGEVLEESPDRGIPMFTDWLSSPQFLKLRNEHEGVFENQNTAVQMLVQNFDENVWPMVEREFRNNDIATVTLQETEGVGPPVVGGMETTPTAGQVGYRITGGGMEFFALDQDNTEAVRKARKLNRELAPVINKTVKAMAHLEGNNDYRAMWERVGTEIMGIPSATGAGDGSITAGGGEAESGGGQGEDVLGNDYRTMAQNTAQQYGVNPELFTALVNQESGFDPEAESPAGALGLTQALPDTAADPGYGIAPLTDMEDPEEQLRFGAEYLSTMINKFDGDVKRALVAYNWGPGKAESWDGKMSSLPKETRNYVNTIMNETGGEVSTYEPREIDYSSLELNTGMNPIIDTDEGLSSQTRDGAVERMNWVINEPFQRLQENFGGKITINDALAKEGTSREKNTPGSRHFHGDALDLDISGMSDEERVRLVQAALDAGFQGFGFGNGILHIDMGSKRVWNYNNSEFAGMPVEDAYAMVTEGAKPPPQGPWSGSNRTDKKLTTSNKQGKEETKSGYTIYRPDQGMELDANIDPPAEDISADMSQQEEGRTEEPVGNRAFEGERSGIGEELKRLAEKYNVSMEELVDMLDQDNDGKLSKEEVAEAE